METKCGNQTLHGTVSATYVPSQDVLEQQTTETANYSALMELNNFSVRLSFIARKLLATVLSQDQDRPSLEGVTLSLCKYASELAGYGVIARRNHDEMIVRCHMTT